MLHRLEIAVGYLTNGEDDQPRHFRLWLIADNHVELHYDSGGVSQPIHVDMIDGYDVTKAIEKEMEGTVTINYAQSRLAWSGGIRPLVQPTGPLKTKRVPLPRRTIRSS